jgi:hypothetical protein
LHQVRRWKGKLPAAGASFVWVRSGRDVLAALAKAAKEDGRSATGVVEKILSDWLK